MPDHRKSFTGFGAWADPADEQGNGQYFKRFWLPVCDRAGKRD